VIKLIAIGGVAALIGGFFAGWQTRDAFCDAASAKAEVQSLRTQLDAREKATKQDQVKAAEDADARSKLEGTVRDLETKISAGVCLDADDAERLRQLWQ
jgi:hypothetical protein